MRDPFYAGLMFMIEQKICVADGAAKEAGIILKDSQIQSALTKARGLAAGKEPKIEGSTEAEQILKALILSIYQTPKITMEPSGDTGISQKEEPLQMTDWILAIEAVVDSIKTRRSDVPGSRNYLDFVHDFSAQVKADQ